MKYLHDKDNNGESLQKYIDLVTKEKLRSAKIMFLVPRSNLVFNYKNQINLDFSEELNITTYIGFVKKELVKYWPIILKKCAGIKKKCVSPVFISNNLCEYLLISKVEEKRNLEGYFADITATSRSIANSIKLNIEKSAYNLVDLKSIGNKIYSSKKNKDSMVKFSYSQMDEIIDYYMDTLLSNAMLDSAMSVYLYNKFLLNDSDYLERLCSNLDYLIVDSLELSSNAEVEFVDKVSKCLKETHIYFDRKKDYSVFNNVDFDYINEIILSHLDNSVDFDEIYKSATLGDIYSLDLDISLDDSSQLYNQMVDAIDKKIDDLIKNGADPKDMVLISPINNTVLDMRLKSYFSRKFLNLKNTKVDRKITDYPYANALLVAACILFDKDDYINDEEYINFIEVVLGVNPIVARNIFNDRFNIENGDLLNDLDCKNYRDYKTIIDYIKGKKDIDIEIYEFLIKFYVNHMLQLKHGKENVKICKQIVHESKSFTENIELLEITGKKNKEEIFIEAFKMTTYDYYTIMDLNEIKDGGDLILTTPYAYISSEMNRPIQIWVDIGSNLWSMKIEKEISNLVVLRKSFGENLVFTKVMEESYKKFYLYNTIYNILSSAKKVYAFKSEYSVNGYVQESNLYGIFMKMLSGKESDNLE
ncbi:hypothetical protein [Metaclostridioides mangenotii]|uniref:hypothetical protein n=1 Tax=Metaclostridioides mangenotii TaxID=1540 RepID=UPI0004804546|nr:hypothetical protein [Clostridioides mangenotii]